jgi:hypothetical protein
MSVREAVAERRRVAVRLNLGELEALVQAAQAAGGGSARREPVLHRAGRRVERARDRRRRAVERAGRR